MTRLQRLGSALGFLLWGGLFLGLWLLVAYLSFGLRVLPHENSLVGAALFGLAIMSGIGLVGGVYLLVRVVI